MVECRDLIAKFLRHIHDQRHFIGTVAVIVDKDFTSQHPGERFHRKITRGVCFFGLFPVFNRLRPCLAIDRHIAHPRLRHLIAAAVNALWIFAARHFKAIRRAGEFHPLNRARINIFECDRTTTKQVRRTGQNLKRRYPAIGQRAGKAGILRPDAMFGPNLRADWACDFIPVRMRINTGRRIIAEMTMNVNNSGRHPFASAVDNRRARGGINLGTNFNNLAVAEQHRAVFDPSAFAVINGDIGDQRFNAPISAVG